MCGVDGLCVVDVLVMLMLVGGNMNVLLVMIGECVVDFIVVVCCGGVLCGEVVIVVYGC